ncbi:sugar phosphate isomerase/epimerase [Actinopolymorpha sp. B11F2]|uniref:sugar phosphate isomerase/epimerase family protein n=1 Tax=Actinopolymorpha sp. B11F2 TaxID=3160862 RepID=UPI0032E50AAA
MKIAFSKPTAGPEEQRLLFDRFREAGYAGLQLKGGQYGSYLDDPEAFRNEWSRDSACTTGLITGGTLDPDGLARLRSTIEFASAVGSERIVFCHGLPRAGLSDTDIAGFARVLSEVGREAADQGIALSLHHHYNQPVMHRRDFDVFFDAADHSAVHLTVDTAHLVKSGVTDVAGLVSDFASVIDNLHLKDFADGEWRLLGEGVIDLDGLFATLRSIDYRGWLCVDEETSTGLVHAMDVSMEYVRLRV